MYYFNARYLPQGGPFISRDPLFEKYFYLSPYAYCSNNPINRVDPTGMTDYEVDMKNQTMTAVKGTEKKPDRLIVKNEKGETITSKKFAKGTISQLENLVNNDGNAGSRFSVSNDKARGEIFEFLAENTDSEWQTLNGSDANGNGINLVGTNYQPHEVSVLNDKFSEIRRDRGTVNELTHSHNKYSIPRIPSGYDVSRSDWQKGDHGNARKFPDVIQRVYDSIDKVYYNCGDQGFLQEPNKKKR